MNLVKFYGKRDNQKIICKKNGKNLNNLLMITNLQFKIYHILDQIFALRFNAHTMCLIAA